jgi:hypothetical protein
MIEIKHGRATLHVLPERAQQIYDALAKLDKGKGPKLPKPKGNPKHDSSKRYYPVFEPGMPTAEYLRQYASLNAHVHLLPAGFDHADRPAAMLDPSYPEVITHED